MNHVLIVVLAIIGIVAIYLGCMCFLGRFLGFNDRKRSDHDGVT